MQRARHSVHGPLPDPVYSYQVWACSASEKPVLPAVEADAGRGGTGGIRT